MFLSVLRRWLKSPSERSRPRPRPAARPRRCRPCLEPLEDRLLLATYVVNSVGDAPDGNYGPYNDHVADTGHTPLFDSDGNLIGFTPYTGVCTLRAAIQQANAEGVPAEIDFAIPGGGVHTILTGGLPAITVPIVIDGTTQPGYASGAPAIEVKGMGGSGLGIGGDGSTVRGLVINGFSGPGIALTSSDNLVAGNFIGTDATGTAAVANAEGVVVYGAGNTIGGTTAADRNVISGNLIPGGTFGNGVTLFGPGNTVEGNFIGTDVTGKVALPNGIGVCITGSDNTVGGVEDPAANLISGNVVAGVFIDNSGSDNKVEGNFIGTDVTGAAGLGNTVGVQVLGPDNLIGGPAELVAGRLGGAGNVISGNSHEGVLLKGTGATGNTVAGNFIGTDDTGTMVQYGNGLSLNGLSLGNGFGGVAVDGAADNTVGGPAAEDRNVISGNFLAGVLLTGAGATGNKVQGNFIGTDVEGKTARDADGNALGNTFDGVLIDGAPDNLIGGTFTLVNGKLAGEGNLISGNGDSGVHIKGTDATTNTVTGNFIGTDVTGKAAVDDNGDPVGNGGDGVLIEGAPDNFIGVLFGPDNVISGNIHNGVHIAGTDATGNKVQGNYIGTDVTGTVVVDVNNDLIGNHDNGVLIEGAADNVIGVVIAGDRNLISGNQEDGVAISGKSATGNKVFGNFIGTDVTGSAITDVNGKPLGNVHIGVSISGAPDNLIGGSGLVPDNVISGNLEGVVIVGPDATGNKVQGNEIGTDAAGTGKLGNSGEGVRITDAPANLVGGPGAGNVISGNATGILINDSGAGDANGNKVQGNFIGTDITGTVAIDANGNRLGNGLNGIQIDNAPGNFIGAAGAANVISGNGYLAAVGVPRGNGVLIDGAAANGNTVQSNFIGTDVTGTRIADANGNALGNAINGVLLDGAPGNVIGLAFGPDNVISGNLANGVQIKGAGANGNTVQGNSIGTDVTGTQALGNGMTGVLIVDAPNSLIGVAGVSNLISGNGGDGVQILDSGAGAATGNRVQNDLIGTDVTGAAALANGGNGVLVSAAPANFIGGAAGLGNVISANAANGVLITGAAAVGNWVQSNSIGTDVAGTAGLGNALNGVLIVDAPGTTVGGVGTRNIIADNKGDGVKIQDTGGGTATGNWVQSNLIGVDVTGAGALGNGGNGVALVGGAPGNTVGGIPGPGGVVPAGQGNTIAFNTGAGVTVVGAAGVGNRLLTNSIFSNTVLGIDLNADGVTPNDSMGHVGPNTFQNFPVLTSAVTVGPTTSIVGKLHSTPGLPFRVEFFSNNFAHPSGFGEGKTFLGFATVTTDAGGDAPISVVLPAAVAPGQFITATATDPGNNTSEFSGSVMVGVPATDLAVTVSHSPDPALVGAPPDLHADRDQQRPRGGPRGGAHGHAARGRDVRLGRVPLRDDLDGVARHGPLLPRHPGLRRQHDGHSRRDPHDAGTAHRHGRREGRDRRPQAGEQHGHRPHPGRRRHAARRGQASRPP